MFCMGESDDMTKGKPHEPLPADEAHLWIVRPERARNAGVLERYEPLLSSEERAKRDRFRFPKDRELCLIARAVVRTTLSRYADISPTEWRFVTNAHGRPEIDQPEGERSLKFNLSHTKGLVVLAVAREREVGVDVEDRERGGKLLDVAERFFSPYEVAALRRLPENEQLDRFFFYWTLKEAYIKARGKGLAIPLSQFSFELDEDRDRGIRIAFGPKLEDDPDRWQFTALSFGRQHRIAVGVERRKGETVRLVARETVPLDTLA
jgi:4'-phosphopantetheinyl transferase